MSGDAHAHDELGSSRRAWSAPTLHRVDVTERTAATVGTSSDGDTSTSAGPAS
jgi:hypothetical protein